MALMPGGTGGSDILGIQNLQNTLQSINQNISQLITVIKTNFPRGQGAFTLAAANSLTVADTTIKPDSKVFIMPTNAAAATLMSGAKSLYHDVASNVAGASFKVKTADGNVAAGTETFNYFVINPA